MSRIEFGTCEKCGRKHRVIGGLCSRCRGE